MALGDFPNSLYWLIVHLSMTLFIMLVYKTKSVLVDPPTPTVVRLRVKSETIDLDTNYKFSKLFILNFDILNSSCFFWFMRVLDLDRLRT